MQLSDIMKQLKNFARCPWKHVLLNLGCWVFKKSKTEQGQKNSVESDILSKK